MKNESNNGVSPIYIRDTGNTEDNTNLGKVEGIFQEASEFVEGLSDLLGKDVDVDKTVDDVRKTLGEHAQDTVNDMTDSYVNTKIKKWLPLVIFGVIITGLLIFTKKVK